MKRVLRINPLGGHGGSSEAVVPSLLVTIYLATCLLGAKLDVHPSYLYFDWARHIYCYLPLSDMPNSLSFDAISFYELTRILNSKPQKLRINLGIKAISAAYRCVSFASVP